MIEPFVGIVIPCHNAAATVGRAIKSVSLSHYSNYEVILVNDGSTDNTLDILKGVAALDSRFVVIDQPNSGLSAACNRGVAASSADYIAFLDANDIFFDTSLSERMKVFALEDDPEMIGVFCPSIMLGENLEILRQEPLLDHQLPLSRLYFSSLRDSSLNPTSVIIKKSAFTAAGGFDESLCINEDCTFWHRVMPHGGYFLKTEGCFVGLVQHTFDRADATMPAISNDSVGDIIEILPVSLIDENREIAEMIHRRSSELGVGLGWHYLLDLIWIIRNIRTLPPGSVILDAGAGNGLLQFILADMGFRVISADFSERVIPQSCLASYTILQADSGKVYDNDYIRHLSTEFQVRKHTDGPAASSACTLRNLIDQCNPGTIIYYRVDLCNMAELDDASIDCIVSVSALEHNSQENLKIAVLELERVLKPGQRMLISLSAADKADWYHEQSKGWCLTESTITRLFFLQQPRSNFVNYDMYFRDLQSCDHLQKQLDTCYYRSGNNGMPWGRWDPKYQPVGVLKLRRVFNPRPEIVERIITAAEQPQPSTQIHHAPMAAFIDVTDGCNLHCIFCSRNNGKIRMMSVEEFRRILDRVSPYINSLQLSCAWEYSISPHAADIVRVLGSYGIGTTTIYTNGQIMSDALANNIIEAGISNLVFSIGEATRETYERIRRGGIFDRVIGNISKIQRMKEQVGSRSPRLCTNLTVINSNLCELPEFVDLSQKLGISEIRGRHLILNEGMDMDTEIVRDKAYANGIIKTAQARAERYGIAFQVPLYSGANMEKDCRAPWSQLYIASNGDAAVCPRIHKFAPIGNLLQQEMKQILDGAPLANLQHQMKTRSFANPVCGICTQNKEMEIYINQGF